MKIYFAASIRGGREDWESYLEIVRQLRDYGQVLTEHVGNAELSASGETLDDRFIHERDLGWLKESDYLVAEVTTRVSALAMKSAKRLNGASLCYACTGRLKGVHFPQWSQAATQ